MKKIKKNKYANHPFSTDYGVLDLAFRTLQNEIHKDGKVLVGYKGVTKEAYDQHQYETQRVKEVHGLMLHLYTAHLKNDHNIVITHDV